MAASRRTAQAGGEGGGERVGETRHQAGAGQHLGRGVLLAQPHRRLALPVPQHGDRHPDLLALRVLRDPGRQLGIVQVLRDGGLGGRRQHQPLHGHGAADHGVGPGDGGQEFVDRGLRGQLVLFDGGEGRRGLVTVLVEPELAGQLGLLGAQLGGVDEGEEPGGLIPAEPGGVLVDFQDGAGEGIRGKGAGTRGCVGHGSYRALIGPGIGN